MCYNGAIGNDVVPAPFSLSLFLENCVMSKATKNFRQLRSTRYVNLGEVVSVNYPKHGKRNVLTKHCGEVVAIGTGPNGRYITIKGEGGVIRSLSESKMVKLRKHLA